MRALRRWEALGPWVVLALPFAPLGCRSAPPEALGFEMSFEGNQELNRSMLEDVIEEAFATLEPAGTPLRVSIDDAAFELELHYRELGFASASVDYDFDSSAVPARVTFRIEEGPRTQIRKIEIVGNTAFTDEQLLSYFKAERELLFGGSDSYFRRSLLQRARSSMETAYLNAGFLAVVVDPPVAELTEDQRNADILVKIEEGQKHWVAEIALSGLDPEQETKLSSSLKSYVGRPYYPRMSYEIQSAISEFLGRNGYPDASVEEKRTSEAGAERLAFSIVTGPLVTISSISFEGNKSTRRGFLLKRFDVEAGDRYDSARIAEGVRTLFRTGLFSKVTAELEPGDASERALTVRVEELPSIELFVEPGYGSYEKLRLRVGFRENNLFGSGRSLRSEATGSVRFQEAKAGLYEQALFGSKFGAGITTNANRREQPSFTSEEIGAGLFVSRAWKKAFSTTLGYQFRRSLIDDIDVVDPDVMDALENVDISSVLLVQQYDTRSNPFAPQKGVFGNLLTEVGDEVIGSELNFVRAQLSLATYGDLTRNTVLAASYRTGAILPLHEQDTIPLQERYFNGGENSVRSFKEDELGPKDANGNPIGGESFHTANIELRQRLHGNLEGAVFVDAGNLIGEGYGFTSLSFGIGAGLRYLLPIGPLRLDAAFNPDAEDDEDTFVLHFSVGMPF